ncbi:rod shape-determining protein MreD [Leadbettera azotonutricia]|uniref:Rod shape-determining protein MreD n=1 Tax=Leadbettera azotonutricia (strain ATCC BAA-888 / DSM 13862 / ZAS-9) TaxID=545695 RepID=F5YC81_LEAAZ|nr:rod shape-determining protein MreD [Leadbettera azotonutricia]AEF83287.1 rod shape-determining protein MreD [Leadbettera azotonutricia ZAS-9]
MAKKIFWAVVFCIAAALLQSTLFRRLAIYHAVPDLVLGIVVYTAYVNGTMTGQLTGFFSGLLLDFLSAAPLGLNAFVRTLAGALAGLMKGAFFLDPFLLPMALCAGATVLKALVFFLLHLLLVGAIPSYDFAAPLFWVELGMNIVSAPFLFGFLRLFESLLAGKRET